MDVIQDKKKLTYWKVSIPALNSFNGCPIYVAFLVVMILNVMGITSDESRSFLQAWINDPQYELSYHQNTEG